MALSPHNLRTAPSRRPGRRGGFTFIEVMFAVMILGFGVIMVAAMLPVALRQTQTARENVSGSAVCERGFHTLEAAYAGRNASGDGLPTSVRVTNGPAEAGTYPAAGPTEAPYQLVNPAVPLFHITLGDRVNSADPATAFIPFYLGDGSDAAPLVTIVGVGARNVPALSDPDAPAGSALQPGQFFVNPANCPLPVEAEMNANVLNVGGRDEQVSPPTLTLAGRAGVGDDQVAQAAVEGAAVVLRDEKGRLRALRLSKATDDTGLIWELAPGGDFTPDEARLTDPAVRGSRPRTDVVAYLVGRMLKNPGAAWTPGAGGDNKYVGPTQVTQVLESQRMP